MSRSANQILEAQGFLFVASAATQLLLVHYILFDLLFSVLALKVELSFCLLLGDLIRRGSVLRQKEFGFFLFEMPPYEIISLQASRREEEKKRRSCLLSCVHLLLRCQ